MFGLVSKRRYNDVYTAYGRMTVAKDKFYDKWCESQKEIVLLKAELARERNVHTDYWLDSAGRWRHPDKPCKCVKASVVMTAQLRKEKKAKLKRKEADNAYKKVGA